MVVKCPHCGKPIDLIGTRELRDKFHLTDNQIQHAREQGKMPDPWLSLENRFLYLREDIIEYVEERSRVRVGGAVKEILSAIQNLPEKEQVEARKILNDELAGKRRSR